MTSGNKEEYPRWLREDTPVRLDTPSDNDDQNWIPHPGWPHEDPPPKSKKAKTEAKLFKVSDAPDVLVEANSTVEQCLL